MAPDPTRRPGPDDDQLFEQVAATGDRRARNELVERHLGLAHHIAARYARGAASREDAEQVALVALVKAVDRFDPARGVAFSTFAGRTIEGELKRHLRDATWSVRVPRSLKELHLQVQRGVEDLAHELGRSATVHELAEHLDVSTDAVVGALGAGAARRSDTLDAPTAHRPTDHQALLGHDDDDLEAVEARAEVEALLEVLEPREREIVRLRFFERRSQSEIAEAVGMSQMHVSRLLRRSFADMRAAAAAPGDELPPEV